MEAITKQVESLKVFICPDRDRMGIAAAKDAALRIRRLIDEKGEANVIFAAAPSQNEMLDQLQKEDIDWRRVRAYHMDEYIGIDAAEPAGFGNFLDRAIFSKVPFMEKHYLLCKEDEYPEKCRVYEALLKAHPADLVLLGIGENGHLAFNDPAVADFRDPLVLKAVELDAVCRQQQVNDGCFPSLEAVPKRALTMTMSYLMSVPEAVCTVPGPRKADAVFNALCGPVTEACPASILRRHPSAALYLDRDSASRIL
ncbi:MAG: glucosamine-6-phosphate deaminase [Clostridiales bacterium]|nr:glucosamine-6-phosphate deaminase [Clostridiales bacterium]